MISHQLLPILRAHARVSQDLVAKRLGITQGEVSRRESGQVPISEKDAAELDRYLALGTQSDDEAAPHFALITMWGDGGTIEPLLTDDDRLGIYGSRPTAEAALNIVTLAELPSVYVAPLWVDFAARSMARTLGRKGLEADSIFVVDKAEDALTVGQDTAVHALSILKAAAAASHPDAIEKLKAAVLAEQVPA